MRSGGMSITGTHIVLYSTDSVADRRFFRNVLEFPFVDAGDGWLIFSLPPAEAAIHPSKTSKKDAPSSLFLMCDDLDKSLRLLRAKKVKCKVIGEESWGKVAMIKLPSGSEIGLYEPHHAIAHK